MKLPLARLRRLSLILGLVFSSWTCGLPAKLLGSETTNLTTRSSSALAHSQKPPHIVHIIADDLGWHDVGFHGSEIRTPNLDALADQSIVLDRFYVTPICSPTRAGLLTGRYPFRYGIWSGVVSPTKRHGLPPSEMTTPEYLARAGYERRAIFGKWHLGLSSTCFHPLNHGFTYFYGHYNGAIDYFSHERFGEVDWHRNDKTLDEPGYSTDLVAEEVASFIMSHEGDQPFYMVVAFNAPHSPIQAPLDQLKRYKFDPTGPLAPNTDRKIAKRENALDYGEEGKGNTVRQTYAAMVSSLDDNLGRILEAIEKRGIEEQTLVVFHSDNGGIPTHGGSNQPLRGNKFTTWEGGVRVVAMIRWPKVLAPARYEGVTAYVDVLPTLLAAAQMKVPSGLDGINLLPALRGTSEPSDRTVLLGEKTVVSSRWKLREGEFFDLKADPNETGPVSQPPLSVVKRFRADLKRFEELRGPKFEAKLPPPKVWPPPGWRLPEEPDASDLSDSKDQSLFP